MSTYEDTDARDLDLYNASRVVAHKPNGFKMVPDRYSDDYLTLNEMGPFPGDRNAARYLRKLDTVERRKRAVNEAHTLLNIIPGMIYSGAVSNAVSALLRAIEIGLEGERLYGENFAHVARERERELRQVTGNPNAIYNPFH